MRLKRLYGDEADALFERLAATVGRYGVALRPRSTAKKWDESDVVLITYADMVKKEGETPLATLRDFVRKRLRGTVNTVHILPFYPWSSDDGFSVIDYRKVASEYGNWVDIETLGKDFKLMFDLVLNHCSAKSPWFRDFVSGIAPARFYFLPMDPKTDLSQVVRPRSSPLLTATQTRDGEAHVWTTFSADQVDLNWQNPDLFFEFVDILFLYIAAGVRILRLDAVAFLWKNIGTDCLHQPETHEVVKLLRDILEMVAPEVVLLTETNVPHEENISYFGRGDEAHMVYQFSLPPLLLHALLAGNTRYLTEWAASLPEPPKGCTWFNFTASHDGIGVRPLQGILSKKDLNWIIEQVKERGGRVSMKSNADGSESPYELNITYIDALGEKDNPELGMERFLCSQAVAMAMKGVPAVYFHSLTGTHNFQEGVEETGHNRTINRRKWEVEELNTLLDNNETDHSQVFRRYAKLLQCRSGQAAFHPDGGQEVIDMDTSLFAFIRKAPDKSESIFCLYNFAGETQTVDLIKAWPALAEDESCRDLVKSRTLKATALKELELQPYQVLWLKSG